MAKNTIFELNGKAYDALTGAMLGDAQRVAQSNNSRPVQPIQVSQPVARRSVDGIVTRPAHVAAHQPQPTKTLMRHAVKAPVLSQKPLQPALSVSGLTAKGRMQPLAPTQASVAPKLSSTSLDHQRVRRANIVGRSQAVKHFTANSDLRRPYAAASVPVRRSVATAQAGPLTASAPQNSTSIRTSTASLNQFAQPQAMTAPQDDDNYEQDLFEQALAHATSHQETLDNNIKLPRSEKSRRKRNQVLGIAGSLTVFLLLFVVIAYQNRANIQLQLASAKAGFSASVPLYKPDGYKLGKLDYAPGAVAAVYKHGNDQSFTLTQKKSNWNSQTLLENFVAASNQDYEGYQSNGRTVYVYGKGNATWVNGGIWYQIKDPTASLSNEQLVKIAASI